MSTATPDDRMRHPAYQAFVAGNPASRLAVYWEEHLHHYAKDCTVCYDAAMAEQQAIVDQARTRALARQTRRMERRWRLCRRLALFTSAWVFVASMTAWLSNLM